MILFWLFVSHAICDYPLQGDFLAKFKNRHMSTPTGEIWWPHALSAHVLIHAGGVMFVTNRLDIAIAEFIAHFMIDFSKCEGWFGFHIDQALHIVCKIIWFLLLVK